VLFVVAAQLVCASAWAHVAWEAPEEGAVLTAGSEVELRWYDAIVHDTVAYHLEFLPGGEAAAVEIVSNLDPSLHSYVWQVPAEPCSDCAVYVFQDNGGGGYDATRAISIVAGPAAAASTAPQATPATATSNDEPQDSDDSEGFSCGLARSTRGDSDPFTSSWFALAFALTLVRRRTFGRH
jgi:hypothetical protein